jgi:hypothetical protein
MQECSPHLQAVPDAPDDEDFSVQDETSIARGDLSRRKDQVTGVRWLVALGDRWP